MTTFHRAVVSVTNPAAIISFAKPLCSEEEALALIKQHGFMPELRRHEPARIAYKPTTDYELTLQQLGDIVFLEKSSMRAYKKRLPPPDYPGSGRKPDRWKWSTVRPSMLRIFTDREIPEVPPKTV